ncbi:non-canonical purine NTP diphosphatase [Costertonia aggregata]|uniref:dITP/XTP pyrophosphatase n=1 Tax=Costertonia aggregata TaxID=343403 RepID=A0A7H9AK59_9FLAO|nr:non-canonical purine NTP diphosphatase [Costertonia aggregata]QLG43902.1 non-canonical purine NTP diphosphatase [Costertonia aggregata]
MKLVFATHNQNKFEEVKKMVPKHIELVSLADIGCTEEIQETGGTLEENAKIKAHYIAKTYNFPCFADDTGLLVDVLNGEPGVYSARYAGEQKKPDDNMLKLLKKLQHKNDRTARFKTVIALNLNKEQFIFEGTVEGEIVHNKMGKGGFGYDPIFKPNGYRKTFAELPLGIKNKISHRGIAIQKLIDFLQKPINQ